MFGVSVGPSCRTELLTQVTRCYLCGDSVRTELNQVEIWCLRISSWSGGTSPHTPTTLEMSLGMPKDLLSARLYTEIWDFTTP